MGTDKVAMPEYIVGHEFIREPSGLLQTGAVVNTHTHNHHHNTHLISGLWEVHRFQQIVDEGGQPKADGGDGFQWLALPVVKIRGGGPRSIIPIPANMRHRFVVLEGPAFYRCCFVHRDADGNPSEIYHGYDEAYV
jgi:hypothetical protein